jgi:hypothetical protein
MAGNDVVVRLNAVAISQERGCKPFGFGGQAAAN